MRKQKTITGDHNLTELNGTLEPKFQTIPSNWIVENLISRCLNLWLLRNKYYVISLLRNRLFFMIFRLEHLVEKHETKKSVSIEEVIGPGWYLLMLRYCLSISFKTRVLL